MLVKSCVQLFKNALLIRRVSLMSKYNFYYDESEHSQKNQL